MVTLHSLNLEMRGSNRHNLDLRQYSGQNGVLGRVYVLLRRFHRT